MSVMVVFEKRRNGRIAVFYIIYIPVADFRSGEVLPEPSGGEAERKSVTPD